MDYLLAARVLLENTESLFIANEIRIAQTLQFQGNFEAAEKIYIKLENQAAKQPDKQLIIDFIHQHKGKNYFEWGKLDKALSEIHKALVIRQKKGNPSLIASSKLAIEVIKYKLSN